MKKIRWGILGAGDIVSRWMRGARQLDDMEIVAIASRRETTAKAAALKYGILNVCTYEELVCRDDIDVVYVATINTTHKDLTMMALNHGKAVLVEKPAGVHAAEFEEMADCARKNHTFLMEAAWTRFSPVYPRVREIIASGEIGAVRLIQSAFAFRMPVENPASRLLDPKQGGGSLLDVGVYNMYFADLVLGKQPVRLIGTAAVNTDENQFGVDETTGVTALFDKGEIAVMMTGIRCDIPNDGYIYGSKGRIEIPYFWKAQEIRIITDEGERVEKFPVPQHVEGIADEGYQYEIAHVNACVRSGMTESDVVPFAKTLEVLTQCDLLRNEWGIE